jgi:hypothetical protein
MTAPCGGCPPCCKNCVFSADPADAATSIITVMPKEEYGCVRPDGGAVVTMGGTLGMMRGQHFHPVTPGGAQFLRKSGNSLAALC